MFTGIVSAVGRVKEQSGAQHAIACPPGWLGGAKVGDSIAVNGVCLTITRLRGDVFFVDVCAETRKRAAAFVVGDKVNLEQALAVGDKLGGHFVTGHIDGVATIEKAEAGDDGGRFLRALPPAEILPFVAQKGSVALAGVSLTVNAADERGFEVYLVPHTLRETNLGALAAGAKANIEADILARHVTRAAEFGGK